MTPEQLHRLRALLARGCFLPEARALALLMLKIHERKSPGATIAIRSPGR